MCPYRGNSLCVVNILVHILPQGIKISAYRQVREARERREYKRRHTVPMSSWSHEAWRVNIEEKKETKSTLSPQLLLDLVHSLHYVGHYIFLCCFRVFEAFKGAIHSYPKLCWVPQARIHPITDAQDSPHLTESHALSGRMRILPPLGH